jgi:hypothetical protein
MGVGPSDVIESAGESGEESGEEGKEEGEEEREASPLPLALVETGMETCEEEEVCRSRAADGLSESS